MSGCLYSGTTYVRLQSSGGQKEYQFNYISPTSSVSWFTINANDPKYLASRTYEFSLASFSTDPFKIIDYTGGSLLQNISATLSSGGYYGGSVSLTVGNKPNNFPYSYKSVTGYLSGNGEFAFGYDQSCEPINYSLPLPIKYIKEIIKPAVIKHSDVPSLGSAYVDRFYDQSIDGVKNFIGGVSVKNLTLSSYPSGKVTLVSPSSTTPSSGSGIVYTLPANYGASGNFLKTDGLGITSWGETSVSSSGTVTSVAGTGTVSGLTLTGTVTSSGSLTLGGTLSAISLTTGVSGILPVANGGTNLSSLGTSNQVLGVNASGTALVYLTPTIGGFPVILTSAQENDILQLKSWAWKNTSQESLTDGGNF